MLICIETHRTCDFPGRVQTPYLPSGFTHANILCAGSNSPLDVINYHVNAIKKLSLLTWLCLCCSHATKKNSFLMTWPKYDPRREKTCLPVLKNMSSGFATR